MTELTFTKRVITQLEQSYSKEISLINYVEDRNWGMFTKAGDKSITNKALGLIKKLEKAKTTTQKFNALTAFLRSYRRMGSTKTMSEASDTAVRECVGSFFDKVCIAVGIGQSTADEIWESPESGY